MFGDTHTMSSPLIESASFLRPSQKAALQQQLGFVHIADVVDSQLGPIEMSKRTGGALSAEEAATIIQAALQYTSSQPKVIPLHIALERELAVDSSRIATFSKDLDELLGGGVALGTVTEFCGAPGVGKTQISMQVAVSCFLPKVFGGLGDAASCLYIDTEGSFVGSRYREIAAAAVVQVTRIANQQHWHTSLSASEMEAMRREANTFTVERVLQRTHFVRCSSLVEMLATIHSLTPLIATNPTIKLVVIDSIAFPIRAYSTAATTGSSSGDGQSACTQTMDMGQRSRLVFHIGQTLNKVATESRVAIVVTNQVTSRMIDQGGQKQAVELIPALGDSWAHCVSTRVVVRTPNVPSVQYDGDGASQLRIAALWKSPCCPLAECNFLICSNGIRNANNAPQQALLQS